MKIRCKLVATMFSFVCIFAIGSYFFIHKNKRVEVDEQENVISYDVSKEMNEVLAMSTENKAHVISQIITPDPKITLCFEGISNHREAKQILSLLKTQRVKAVFFLSGLEVAEDPELVKEMIADGHNVETYGFTGVRHMEDMTREQLAKELLLCKKIYQEKISYSTKLLRMNATKLNDDILIMAKACGYHDVINSTFVLDATSFSNLDAAKGFMKKIQPGSIISIKASDFIDESEVTKKKEVISGTPKPLKEEEQASDISEENKLLRTINLLIKAAKELYEFVLLDDLGSEKEIQLTESVNDSLAKNDGKLSENLKNINTTARQLSYIFYGVGDEKEMKNVRETLKQIKAKGTFFVTYDDMKTYGKQIKQLKKDGHEIGLAVILNADFDAWKYAREIAIAKEYYTKKFKDEFTFVMQPYGADSDADALKEASSAMNITFISHTSSIVRGKENENRSAKKIVSTLFPSGLNSFRRGDIIYFRLNYYKNKKLTCDLIKEVTAKRVDNIAYQPDKKNGTMNGSEYRIVTLTELTTSKKCYEFKELKPQNVIKKGYLDGKSEKEKFELLKQFYIGNSSISHTNNLPGFTLSEVYQLDWSGRIKKRAQAKETSKKKTIFLTFDDWGSDDTINHLLYVLDKYDVKATFFVITRNVGDNENLLRSIAEDGHAIASHTNSHLKLSNYDERTKKYTSITKKEAKELENDSIASYNILYNMVGDVKVDGKYALTTLFRPPTLAVSKIGLESVYDAGFSYAINGSYTTHDYEAKSAKELANSLVKHSRDGEIFVMHMSDTACYTAEALDIVIPKLLASGYEFRRIDDYLD